MVDKIAFTSNVIQCKEGPTVHVYYELCEDLARFLHVFLSNPHGNYYKTAASRKEAFWNTVFAGRVDVMRKLKSTHGEVNCHDWFPDIPRHWKPNLPRFADAADFEAAKLWGYSKWDLGIGPFPMLSRDPFQEYRAHRSKRFDSLDRHFHSERFINGRRLYVASKGHIGLGPPSTTADNLVVVLHGGDIPYILASKTKSTFALIGETYVEGIMVGEAVTYYTQRERAIQAFDIE